MKKLLLLSAAFAALHTTLPAQDAASVAQQLAGSWRIAKGQNPGSSANSYTGTVDIVAKSNGVLGFKWNVKPPYLGIGLTNGRLVAAGYSNNSPFGIAVYDAKGDEFVGAWTGSMTKGEVGFETLKATGAGTGVYKIVKGKQPGGADYTGEVMIVKKGDVYEMEWRTGGQVTKGVGIRVGDSLIAGWTTGKDVGVVCYSLLEGLKGMEGSWTGLGATKLGRERLER